MKEKVFEQAVAYLQGDVKRISHLTKVNAFAMYIAKREGLSEPLLSILDMASLLHDIGIHEAEKKYHSTAGIYQEKEGPAIAEKILRELAVDPEKITRVLFLIAHHHTYGQIDGLDYQILVEADFLVNLYEDQASVHAAETALNRYFKTDTGIWLLKQFYLL